MSGFRTALKIWLVIAAVVGGIIYLGTAPDAQEVDWRNTKTGMVTSEANDLICERSVAEHPAVQQQIAERGGTVRKFCDCGRGFWAEHQVATTMAQLDGRTPPGKFNAEAVTTRCLEQLSVRGLPSGPPETEQYSPGSQGTFPCSSDPDFIRRGARPCPSAITPHQRLCMRTENAAPGCR